jgi:hypothetical protein
LTQDRDARDRIAPRPAFAHEGDPGSWAWLHPIPSRYPPRREEEIDDERTQQREVFRKREGSMKTNQQIGIAFPDPPLVKAPVAVPAWRAARDDGMKRAAKNASPFWKNRARELLYNFAMSGLAMLLRMADHAKPITSATSR